MRAIRAWFFFSLFSMITSTRAKFPPISRSSLGSVTSTCQVHFSNGGSKSAGAVVTIGLSPSSISPSVVMAKFDASSSCRIRSTFFSEALNPPEITAAAKTKSASASTTSNKIEPVDGFFNLLFIRIKDWIAVRQVTGWDQSLLCFPGEFVALAKLR